MSNIGNNDTTESEGKDTLQNEAKTSNDKETKKPKKQDKILQGKIRGHLADTDQQYEGECRKLRDQLETTGREDVSNFSAQNGHISDKKASDYKLQMTLNPSNAINRKSQKTTNSGTSDSQNMILNGLKKTNEQIILDDVVAYPPQEEYRIDFHHKSPLLSYTKRGEQNGQIYLHNSGHTKSPIEEHRALANVEKTSRVTIQQRFSSVESEKLLEDNLEYDSLKYEPEDSQIFSSPSILTEDSTATCSTSSSSFLAESFNLMKLTNEAETAKFPGFGTRHVDDWRPRYQVPSLATEILNSLQIPNTDGKRELAIDGPANSPKVTEYLLQNVLPALQNQEEEFQRAQTELSRTQQECDRLMQHNQFLLEKLKQMGREHGNNTKNESLSSQTHVTGWDVIKNGPSEIKQPDHYSVQVSDFQHDATSRGDILQKMHQLEERNQKLTEANHCWEAKWDLLQRKQAAEIERLNQVIRNFKEQDTKRQEEFDKILLTAKRRQNDEEVAKEEALGNLAQMTGNYEGLQTQYEELKRILEDRTEEKNDLQTQLATVKAEKLKTQEKVAKSGSKKLDKNLEQQYKSEIAILKEQLTVFHEDFDRERKDRARAQSQKDDLISQMDLLKHENARLSEQLRTTERNMQTKINQITALQKEVTQLRNQLRQTNQTLQYPHGPQSPVMQTAQYCTPQVQHPRVQNQYSKPKTHPETDPYAQPLPPYLLQAHENGLASLSQNPRQPVPINRPAHPSELLFGSWNCPFCTYVNHPQRTICEICGTHRGQILNSHSGQGSQLFPRGESRQPYDPNDLCIDSGNWLS